jgi:cyclic pyranopterin phosphate synthase
LQLLDIILGYDCNIACDYCTISPGMRRGALTGDAVLAALRAGRADGFDAVSFTGGEPTLRRELPALVRAARGLGFDQVKIQSNGLAFAHAPNVDRLIAAGATLFHVSIHTHLEGPYDRMVRMPGAYALMVAGLRNVLARDVTVRTDAIVTRETAPRLPDAVRWLDRLGVRRLDLWYVSLTDANRDNVASLPKMTEAMPFVAEALAVARAAGMEARSLHIPRCLLGADSHHAWDPGSARVRVITPEATFDLDQSRLAGSVRVPACDGCVYDPVCPGIRPDYLAVFGDGEIAAARAAQAAAGPAGHGGSGRSPIS